MYVPVVGRDAHHGDAAHSLKLVLVALAQSALNGAAAVDEEDDGEDRFPVLL